MKNKIEPMTKLGNPNDSNAGCYAPVENGMPARERKRHFQDGEDHPSNWVAVECDINCS